ncbi:MAG: DNA translocase FtsK 4TM domain-containing protein, partial [Thermoanaerobaculum sp.]
MVGVRLSPSEMPRYVAGFLLLVLALLLFLALVSFHPLDPSWLSAGSDQTHNWVGRVGAWVGGALVGLFGLFSLVFVWALGRVGWRWLSGETVEGAKGALVCLLATVVLGGGLLAGLWGPVPYRGGELKLGGE